MRCTELNIHIQISLWVILGVEEIQLKSQFYTGFLLGGENVLWFLMFKDV